MFKFFKQWKGKVKMGINLVYIGSDKNTNDLFRILYNEAVFRIFIVKKIVRQNGIDKRMSIMLLGDTQCMIPKYVLIDHYLRD